MPYSRVNWKNGEVGRTPLNATNLNKMDDGIKQLESEKVSKNNPDTTGSWTHNGDMFVSGNFRHYEGESLLHNLNVNSIDRYGEPIEFKQEINYKQNDVELDNAFGQIIENKKTIEELESKPTSAMLIESASPLEYATNNNIVGLYAEGKSEQYISKNLMPCNSNLSPLSGELTITPTYSNGKLAYITVNGTNSGVVDYPLWGSPSSATSIRIESGDYYINKFVASDTIQTLMRNGSNNIIAKWGNGVINVASASDVNYALLRFTPSTYSNVKIYPMVSKGSTALPYEPYTGTPSPTNIIPPINASGKVRIGTKNLLDVKRYRGQFAITYTPIYIGANKVVTLSSDIPKTYSGNSAYLFILSGKHINGGSTASDGVWNGQSRTVYADADGYITIMYRNDASNGVEDWRVYSTMLEYGEVASSYVPYKSNSIDLSSDVRTVQNTQDSLVINTDGSAIFTQRIKRVRLSDKNFSFYGSYAGHNLFYWDTLGYDVISEGNKVIAYCNLYTCVPNEKRDSMGNFELRIRIPDGRVYINDDGFSDAATFNNWIHTTDCYIDFILATPIVTNLTKAQVDAMLYIKLRSIGNIADTLTVNEDGSGEWVQKVGVVDLARLGWSYASETRRFLAYEPSHKATNRATKILCNMYVSKENSEPFDANWDNVIYSGNENLAIHNHAYTDTNAFTASLNGSVCYVELATPIIHTLTKEQVDAIRQLKTYEGTTLIDSELANVTIKYAGDTKKYVDDKFIYTSDERLIGSYLDAPLYRRVLYGSDKRFDIANINPKFIYGMNEFGETLVPGEDFVIITLMNPSTMEHTTQIMLLTGTYHEFIIEYTKYTPSGGVGGSSVAPMALSLDDADTPAVVPMNAEEE